MLYLYASLVISQVECSVCNPEIGLLTRLVFACFVCFCFVVVVIVVSGMCMCLLYLHAFLVISQVECSVCNPQIGLLTRLSGISVELKQNKTTPVTGIFSQLLSTLPENQSKFTGHCKLVS